MTHANLFDRYHAADSPLHRLDARVKVVVGVGFILGNALLPDGAWRAFACAWGALLIANARAGLGVWFTLRRSFLALPFALAAVSALFLPAGRPLTEWTLGPWRLTPTDLGLVRFLSILLRSWLSVQAAILLTATTPFPDLIHALEHLRLPRVLTAVIAFLYRYLFVLTDEALRLLRARQARSASLPGRRSGGTLPWRVRTTGHLAGQLFLRSYERADRVYQAMLARGYRGYLRTLRPHRLRAADWRALALAALVLLWIQWIGWVY